MVIGFLGLGEVGSRYSSGIRRNGATVLGFDLKFGEEEFKEKEDRCREYGVELVPDCKTLVERSDIILCPTTVAQTVETAESAAPYLCPGKIYVDFNSAIPDTKLEAEKIVRATGAEFCDACTLNSPVNTWEKNAIIMAGPKAPEVIEVLNGYGMKIEYVGEEIGKAAKLKTIRSIFSKGLEALIIEALVTATHFGVYDEVYSSMVKMVDKESFADLSSRIVRGDVLHSKRRADEVGSVVTMLQNAGMDCTMSKAVTAKIRWSNSTPIRADFGARMPDPEQFRDVINKFTEYSKV